jgi:hypothetical protein
MWRIFHHSKTTTQQPRFHHKTTTTSPQITTQKHTRFSKCPPKNTRKSTKNAPAPRQKKISKETGLG